MPNNNIGIRWVRHVVLAILPFIVLVAFLLYMNGGLGGQTMIDRSTSALVSENSLKVVASLPGPPGNLAISHNGPDRLFFTFHPENNPTIKVAELDLKTGGWRAYPDASWQETFRTVLSVRIDHHNDVLWVLDFAHYGLGTLGIPLTKRFFGTPALYAFGLYNNSLVHMAELGDVAGVGAMLNDFVISPDGHYLYIADTSVFRGSPGLVVYDTWSREARRVLSGHASMYAQKYIAQVEDSGPVVAFHVFAVRPHVDSIALSADGHWLYYAPFSHEHMFRIPAALVHGNFTDQKRDESVEVFGTKSITDGIIADSNDQIYLTDIEHSAIHRLGRDGQLQTLVKSKMLLRWPDGLTLSAGDEELYIACSALHLKFAGQDVSSLGPYHIVKLRLSDLPTHSSM